MERESKRRGIEAAKVELEMLKGLLKGQQIEINSQIKDAQAAYQNELLSYLGARSDFLLAPWTENILQFADEEELDSPQWVFTLLSIAAHQVERINYEFPQHPNIKPSPEHQDYYRFAMDLVSMTRFKQSGGVYWHAQEALKEAERLTKLEEDKLQMPQNERNSLTYRWLHQNLDILFEIHANYFDKNYP